MPNIRPVILSGGSGTRLWPVSTPELPKQFAPLISGRSLFEQTLARFAPMSETSSPLLVSGSGHLELVRRAAANAGVRPGLIIIEPEGRNTAPAAIAAALSCSPDEVLVILPSDHLIADEETFRERVRQAADVASRGHILTFGVVPSRAETGYGYIEQGARVDGGYRVSRFKEKPNEEEAAVLWRDGKHLWNSGIFVVPAGLLIEEATRHAPDILDGVRSAIGDPEDDTLRLGESFVEVEKISLDHAIMEKTSAALVIPIDVGWDDVGSFQALWAVSARDEDDNAISGDVVTADVSGSLILAGSRRVAVVGVEDLVVVETPEAVLVLPRDRSQEVKKLIEGHPGREPSAVEGPAHH